MKQKAAYFGIFLSLALILSYIEMLIPLNFGIPGAKIGLTNLIILIVLFKSGWKQAFVLSACRIILAGFIFGNLFSIIYSLSGAVLSLFAMTLIKNSGKFSVIGISIAGGIFHNIGQLIIAMIIVETYQVGYYLPVLLISGTVAGMAIGMTAYEILKRIENLHFN